MLYPLKFKPRFVPTPWGGGDFLAKAGMKPARGKDFSHVGECFLLSASDDVRSVVKDGFLKSNDIGEVVEVYMGDLVGEHVFSTFGEAFPLELKILSVAKATPLWVCPGDEEAAEYGSHGCDKLWYVADAKEGSCLYLGFNRALSHEEYDRALDEGTLAAYLNRMEVKQGEAFYIPAGTVHAIGAGITVAEVSDLSCAQFAIAAPCQCAGHHDEGHDSCGCCHEEEHDGECLHEHDGVCGCGHDCECHCVHEEVAYGSRCGDGCDCCEEYDLQPEEAEDSVCLHELHAHDANVNRGIAANECARLVQSTRFAVNLISVNGKMKRDFTVTDSFVAYVCVDGAVDAECDGEKSTMKSCEALLVPAETCDVVLGGNGRLLEITML